jgi:hypothetical protein
MTINVTQNHIDAARAGAPNPKPPFAGPCPITLAMNEAGCRSFVGQLPPEAQSFKISYRAGNPVRPFQFEIDDSDCG